jgi:predicted AlkP superfamily pyrophosphatase or phosphodiesterase
MSKLLVVQVAGLGIDLLKRTLKSDKWNGFQFYTFESVFPALTCPVQASFRTASFPSEHGITANGFFDRTYMKTVFWDQSSRHVHGERIWDEFRRSGKKVALLFWQQSLGEGVDFLLSPAPVHKHHGGLIQSFYSKPENLYERLCSEIGRKFNLFHYWGPFSSLKSTKWIVDASVILMNSREYKPDLFMVYLPHLDYEQQKSGPDSNRSTFAATRLFEQLNHLTTEAERNDYSIVIFGDYSISAVDKAIFPNKVLLEEGLFKTRKINKMFYPDFYESRAFAMVDHEIAHIYIKNLRDIDYVKNILAEVKGVEKVLDIAGQKEAAVCHQNSGELLAVASDGYWFSYPWWSKRSEAPDYASHIDIHNKPGYDPCELFFGWPPFHVSQNSSLVRGSHGKTGHGRQTCWASSISFDRQPADIVELAGQVQNWLLKKFPVKVA